MCGGRDNFLIIITCNNKEEEEQVFLAVNNIIGGDTWWCVCVCGGKHRRCIFPAARRKPFPELRNDNTRND